MYKGLRTIFLLGGLLLATGCLTAINHLQAAGSQQDPNVLETCHSLGICAPPLQSSPPSPSTGDTLWDNAYDLGDFNQDLGAAKNLHGTLVELAKIWHEQVIWVGQVYPNLDHDDYLVLVSTSGVDPTSNSWTLLIVHEGKVRLLNLGSRDSEGPFQTLPLGTDPTADFPYSGGD